MNISITKTDPIHASATQLAEGVLSANNVVVGINATTHPNLTAFVTQIAVSETKSGAPIFTNGSLGSIFSTNVATLTAVPYTLKTAAAASTGTLTVAISAQGNACAQGVEALTYTLTLSSKALSGNGSSTEVVTVTATTITLNTTVTAVNTPYGGRTCRAEFARLRNLEII